MKLSSRSGSIWVWAILSAAVFSGAASEPISYRAGGGPLAKPKSECFPAAQRNQIESNIAKFRPMVRSPGPDPALYPFVPIAGTEWQDRFVNNFVTPRFFRLRWP